MVQGIPNIAPQNGCLWIAHPFFEIVRAMMPPPMVDHQQPGLECRLGRTGRPLYLEEGGSAFFLEETISLGCLHPVLFWGRILGWLRGLCLCSWPGTPLYEGWTAHGIPVDFCWNQCVEWSYEDLGIGKLGIEPQTTLLVWPMAHVGLSKNGENKKQRPTKQSEHREHDANAMEQ